MAAEKMKLGTKFDGSPYKALVVDDSVFMVRNLKKMLEDMGVEVLATAENGLEAVEFVENHGDELDFCTLDITMPELDGFGALKQMLEIKPNLIVVMVSAMGQKKTVKKCIRLGAKHFIHKPFSKEKINGVLKLVLGIKE